MSAEKTLEILDLFTYTKTELSVSEIASLIKCPKSSAYRYVRLLREKELLIESKEGYYSLGYKFLKYYRIVRNSSNLNQIVEKPMKDLTIEFDEAVMLLVYSNLQAVCIATSNSENSIKVVSEPGEIAPLYAGGSSKALLAYLDNEKVEKLYNSIDIIKYTDKTITSLDKMKKEILKIRKQGYASSDGELYEGVVGFGVPVFDSNNKVYASLSLSGLSGRMKRLDKSKIIHKLQIAAKKIEKYL